MKEKQKKLRYRHFEVQPGEIALPILGDNMERRMTDEKDFPHFHKYIEIGYCHSGIGKVILGENIYEYKHNNFTFIPPNFPHSTLISADEKDYWEYLFFDAATFLKEMYAQDPVLAKKMLDALESRCHFFNLLEYEMIGKLIMAILENYRNKKDLYKESAKGLFLALIIEIVRLNEDGSKINSFVYHETKPILKSIQYIEDNFSEHLKVSDMAVVCHLSETHFRRVFKEYMGMSPYAYLNVVRVEAVCKVLKDESVSIREAAFRCGFSTLASFNKNFKSVVGVTPGKWREERIKQKKHYIKESVELFNDSKDKEYYGRLR